jgi:hypothetical protein
MSEKGLKFHIKENDYFGTLATVLDLIRQDLRRKGDSSHATRLRRLRDGLIYLQQGYRIEKMEPTSDVSGGQRDIYKAV